MEKEQSIYELIKSNLKDDNSLSHDFCHINHEGIGILDGSQDGKILYYDGNGYKEMPKEMITVFKDITLGNINKAIEKAENLISKEESILYILDMIEEYIVENKDYIYPERLYEFCKEIIKKSRNKQLIKMCLSLLELICLEDNEEILNIICTMGTCDEFTLYSIYALRMLERGNDHIFELAKNTKGWGRIHAVEYVEPLLNEIKKWLLIEGYKNNVLLSHSALTCAQKSDLLERLKKNNFTNEEFECASEIIAILLQDEAIRGIKEFVNDEELLQAYLSCCDEREYSDGIEQTKDDIERYFRKQKTYVNPNKIKKMN